MTHLQERISQLKDGLVEMAGLVSKQLKKAYCSLMDQDEDLARTVIVNEKRVNALELKLDKDCEYIFTLLAPVANDMRFVFATLKINADLERIGDYADGIADMVLLGKRSFDKELIEKLQIPSMYETAQAMLNDATQAYKEENSRLARSLFTRDQVLNGINEKASGIVEEYIGSGNKNINQALLLLSVIRKLERVGDHITNIAEDIIYFKDAEELRHLNKRDDRN